MRKILYLIVVPSKDIMEFRNKLFSALSYMSQEKDREYVPHLTLARYTGESFQSGFEEEVLKITGGADKLNYSFVLDSICLYGRVREEQDRMLLLRTFKLSDSRKVLK
jgi:2'-5' RNA ligase